MKSKLTLFKKWKILFFFFTLLCCWEVDAAHFRGGTISWNCLGGNQVEYTISTQWEGSFSLGSTGFSYNFNYGDGTSQSLDGTVNFVNVSENWFSQVLVITKTYSSPGQYTSRISSCCRINGLPNGWSSDNFILQSTVNAGPGCNEAPALASPAFINIAPGNNQTCFQLNAVDPENDPFSFSITNGFESGLFPDPSSLWPSGTLSPSGLICVNPTTMPGAPAGGFTNGQLIPFPVKVTDINGNGTIPGDIMLRVSTVTGTPPSWDYTVTPADGSTINFFAGVAGSIALEAEDVDAGNTIDINPSGVPAGAIFTPALPNTSSPNSTTLSWTPTIADVGSHPITLIAQDDAGLQTATSFTIIVQNCSAPVASCMDVTVGVDNVGLLTLDPSSVDDGSTADCGLQSIVVSPNSFDCTDVGSTVPVTLTITDSNGDSDNCTSNVTIADLTPPTPLCDLSVTTTLSGVTGEVDVFAFQMDDASVDNCTAYGDLVFSYSGTDMNDNLRTYDCSDVGFNNVSIWVWDEAGNVSEECFAILQVIDNTAPMCETQDITVSLSHMGFASIVVSDIDDGTSDWCGVDTLYLSDMDFDCDDVGVNVVTLTAEDIYGNVSTCDANVTVEDNGHLHIHCQDITVQLDELGEVTIDPQDLDDVTDPAYDNCGVAGFAASKTSFTCADIGTQVVVMTVTDVNGNTASCNSSVTIEDNVPPTPTCNNISVQLDASGNGSITADILDGGSFDACGIDAAGYSATQTSFTCADLGEVTVTLTVTDTNGNTATCDATVTVEDNIAPIISCQDFDIYLDVNGSATVSSTMADGGTLDNCMVSSFTAGPEEVGCDATDYSEFTLLGDYNGHRYYKSTNLFNFSNAVADAIEHGGMLASIEDASENALAASLGGSSWIGFNDILVEGSFVWYSGEAVTYTSWFGGEPNNLGNEDGTIINFGGSGLWNDVPVNLTYTYILETAIPAVDEVSVVLVAEDQSGNTASCLAIATVIDTISPDAVCQDITVQLDGTGNATITAEEVDNGSNDACGVASLSIDDDAFDCDDVGANDIVLTVTDVNGNISTCLSTVTIEDSVDPIATCQDITIQLDVDGLASISGLDVDNESNDACGIDTMFVDIPEFTCAEVGANTVTLTVVDNNGNEAICISTVTVEDNVDPDCSAMDITIVLDALGNYTVEATDIDDGSFDACGIATYEIRRQFTDFFGNTFFGGWNSDAEFSCDDVGDINVQLRITDNNNNNESVCDAVITINDETSPFMNCQDNITVSLNSDGEGALVGINLLAWWGIFDACGIDQILVDGVPIKLYSCADLGTQSVVVTSIDNNGNQTQCTVDIEIRDEENPECETMDITIYLDETGVASIDSNAVDGGSSDNCSIASITLDNQDFDCTMIDENTVTMTVTDQSGNASTCDAIVTVLDTISPVCATMDIIVQLDADGVASIDSNAVDNASSDACGIAFITLDDQDFTCADIGSPVIVTQTVTDVNGNVSTCTAAVTVEDNVAPQALCHNAVVMLDAAGNGTLDPLDLDNGSNDACGIASITASQTSFDCSEVGVNIITLTVEDANGNVSTCSDTVTVVDNVLPVAMCQDVTIQLDASGSAIVVPSDIDNGSFDVCGIAELCVGKGVETSSLAGTISDSDPTFLIDDLAPSNACIFNTAIFNGCCDIQEGLHHFDQQRFTISAPDTYTFTFNSTDGDFIGVIYDSEFNPLDFCQNIIYGDDDSGTGLDPLIVITLTMAPGDYVLMTSTWDTPTTVDIDYTWDVSSVAGGTVSAFECAPALEYDCSEIGDNTVTLCVTDLNGNVSYCSSTVTVEDNVAPDAMCMDITVQLLADGTASIDSNAVDGGSTDACGIASITLDNQDFTCEDVGSAITVTQTVTDVNGNSSVCTAMVTVEDNVAPDAMCMNITVQLDSDGVATIDSNAVDNGSTDVCGIASFSTDITTFGCADVGDVDVVLTVTDLSGNSSTCDAVVTVEDNVDPIAICQDITVQLDFNGDVTVTGDMIDGGSTDACGIASLAAGAGSTDFDCSNVGANTVVLTVTDVHGNEDTCEATVTVEDNVAPLVNCVNNVEVPLNTNGIGFVTKEEVTGATFDACGVVDTFIIRNDEASHPDFGIENEQLFFSCDDLGLVDVIIRVYDTNGNVEECLTAVNVKDDILPTMECTSTVIYLDASGVAALDSNALDDGSYDNCAIIEFSVSQSDFDCSHLGMNLITMTAEDQSGNSSSCSNGVMVLDTVAPVAMCKDITVTLDALGVASITGDMLDDGSTDACGSLTFSADITSFGCEDVGDNTVTMSVSDGSSNVSTCTSTVTVEDMVAPDCQTQDITVQLDATGNVAITAADVDNGSTDACGIASMSVSPDAFTCAEAGANTVTLTLTDVNGNVSTCTAEVTVVDMVAPMAMCKNITLELGADGTASIDSNAVDNGSTDACGIASFSTDHTTFDCSHLGENTVEMTVVDNHGNESSCTATVTVVDVTGPALTCPADITVNTLPSDCNQNVIMPTLFPTDVCTGSATYEYVSVNITFIETGIDTFALFPVGDTEVTVIATDGFGNTSECSFNITVIDNIDPVITGCDDIGNIIVDGDITQCGANVSWDETLINANDNCSGQGSGVAITSDHASGDLFPVGTTTVTYTATDDSGNTATCSFDVTVNPNVPFADFTFFDASLSVSFTNASTNASSYAWDFGDGNTSAATNPTHIYAAAGTYTVCLTSSDVCGNEDTYCEDVTVADSGNLCIDEITMEEGWNLISFDVDPADSSIGSVFGSSLGTTINYISSYDNGAMIYDPSAPIPALNTLQNIAPGFGYWVLCNADVTIVASGTCIDPSFKKDLDFGWNLVSFIPQAPESPSLHLDDLITPGILEFATTYSPTTSTLIFDPTAPLPFLNTLQTMENGWGYWIKVNAPVSGSDWFGKTEDESSTRSGNTDEWGNAKTSAYDFINGTISGAENGDLIDVVNQDGELVIQLEVVADQYLMTTPLYADDPNTTEEIDGLINGEELNFVFNGSTSDVVITFEGSKIIHHVDLEFETSTSVEELEEDRLSIYPNPMFSNATLSIDVVSSGNYQMSIIDASGKVVRSLDLGVLPSGPNLIDFERDHLGAGSYIVLVQNTNQKSIARLPIIIIN